MKRNIRRLLNGKKEYKIYHTKLELFSDGGKEPTYSESGKTYYRLSDVRRHFGQVETNDYDYLIVIEYEVKVKKIKNIE